MNIAVNFSDNVSARDDHDNGDDDDDGGGDDDIDSDDDDGDIFDNWFYWSSCRLSCVTWRATSCGSFLSYDVILSP